MVLPLAIVFALEFTTPPWVALLAVLFLGERMTLARAAALIVCSVGVLVILRPGMESFQPAALLVVFGALLSQSPRSSRKGSLRPRRPSPSCSG